MPPFCAPSPHSLLSEPSTDRSEEHEEDDRAQMIASLVMALSDAEAGTAEPRDADNPDHQHLLATQAYSSLCFDFPIVSTSALAALAFAFRSSTLDFGAPIFPVTERFAAGLRYLVSVEFKEQSSSTQNVDGESEGETPDDSMSRCSHLCALCGYIFILAPALRLARAHKDDGDSLHEFLAGFHPSPVDPRQQDCMPEEFATKHGGLEDFSTRAEESEVESEVHDPRILGVAVEMDDDDSDWEALEAFSPSEGPILEVPASPEIGKAGWSCLMDKVALLAELVPTEFISTSMWMELHLTDHIIEALVSMRMLQEKEPSADVLTTAKLYLELLANHLLMGSSTATSGVAAMVSALLDLVEPDGEFKQRSSSKAAESSRKSWQLLVLSFLSKLCSRVGEYAARTMPVISGSPLRSKGPTSQRSREPGLHPSSTFIRCLWHSLFSNLQFLKVQLTEAALGGFDSISQLEMVFWILCFLVKCAPGNADVRAILLEGGIFRIAVHLFVKVGIDSRMEPLYHFLLVSMASSPALAEFASKVPSFMDIIMAPALSREGSYFRAHAVIWPLFLRAAYEHRASSSNSPIGHSNRIKSSEEEARVVAAFNGIVTAVSDDTIRKNPNAFLKELVWLQWLLVLLEEAASASSGTTLKFWQRGSPVDLSIQRCQVTLGAVFIHETGLASISVPWQRGYKKKSDDIEDKSSSDVGAEDSILASLDDKSENKSVGQLTVPEIKHVAVQEKLRELLPSVLLQLKRLSAHTKENQVSKID